jgi:hypothetical protein
MIDFKKELLIANLLLYGIRHKEIKLIEMAQELCDD